jgi:hypothetical protein
MVKLDHKLSWNHSREEREMGVEIYFTSHFIARNLIRERSNDIII